MMKQSWTAAMLLLLACQPAADEAAPEGGAAESAAQEVALEPVRFDGGVALGEPLTLETLTPISDILANPQSYIGQRVLVKGQVTGVCQEKGCWMDIVSGTGPDTIQIKVDDGVIVFPPDAVGRDALAEGTVEELKLTEAEAIAAAKHEAEEKGTEFDPASVTGPVTIYRIRGIGVQIAPAT